MATPEFVTAAAVAPFTSSEDVDDTITLVNELIEETWANPVTPIPASIKALALGVAVRALSNPKNADSTTKTSDNTSKTERFVARSGDREYVVYLTTRERRVLRGNRRRYGTIRTPRR